MRIGIFGGSFDPVHIGHLIVAEQCREQAQLDQVWFVPAVHPPHKLDRRLTPFEHRYEMLRLAVSGHGEFVVSDVENRLPAPNYTVHTLRYLHQNRPGDEWLLLLGADSFCEFLSWYEPYEVARLATLVVAGRPGYSLPSRWPGEFRVRQVAVPLVEISSTDIRQRVAQRRSIRYLVPRAVECYIANQRLYTESA